MPEKVTLKKIKPAENYGRMKHGEVQTLGYTVSTKLTDNLDLPKPPVDPQVLKAHADDLGVAMVAAQDGGKQAIAETNGAREVVITDLRLIGRYVEETAKGNMAIFLSSGLTPISTSRNAEVSVSANFRSLEHGPLS